MAAAGLAAALGLGAAVLWARSKNTSGSRSLEGASFLPESAKVTQGDKKTSPVYEKNQSIIKTLAEFCPDAASFLGSTDILSAEKAAKLCGITVDINDHRALLSELCAKKVRSQISGTYGDGNEASEKALAKYACDKTMEYLGDKVEGNFVLEESARLLAAALSCGTVGGPVAGAACFGVATIEAALSGRGGPTVECSTLVNGQWVEAPCDGPCDKVGQRGPCSGPLDNFRNALTGRLTCNLWKEPKVEFKGGRLLHAGDIWYLRERDDLACTWHKREATQREIELYGK